MNIASLKALAHGKSRGFSLIEMSVLLTIVAIVLANMLSVNPGIEAREQREITLKRLAVVKQRLDDYLTRNGHYPCVASRTVVVGNATFGRMAMTNCATDSSEPAGTVRVAAGSKFVRIGAVPTRDLLLPDDYMEDGWGNRFSYAISEHLTSSSGFSDAEGVITVSGNAGSTRTSKGAFVVWSHGADGKGAYRRGKGTLQMPCGATSNLDVENCDGDAMFMAADFSIHADSPTTYFDDHAAYVVKRINRALKLTETESAETELTGGAAFVDINDDGASDMLIYRNYAGRKFDLVLGPVTNAVATLPVASNADATWSETGSSLRFARAVGDFNGDGKEDIAMYTRDGGYPHVVFGTDDTSALEAVTQISDLPTTDDAIQLSMLGTNPGGGYKSDSFAACDFNNDGYDDIIFNNNSYNHNPANLDGALYVVFGRSAAAWSAAMPTLAISPLNGSSHIRIHNDNGSYQGIHGEATGFVTCNDINGDGIDDIVTGVKGTTGFGELVALFGHATYWNSSTAFGLWAHANNTHGFAVINTDTGGSNSTQNIGRVQTGDLDGDGIADIIAHYRRSGVSPFDFFVIIFGRASWPASPVVTKTERDNYRAVELASTMQKLAFAQRSVVGNFNGDAYNDLFLAYSQTLNPNRGYFVFGKSRADWTANSTSTLLNLGLLNGTNGQRVLFQVPGEGLQCHQARCDVGDFNDDGFDDVLLGSAVSTHGWVLWGHGGSWDAELDMTDYY